MIDRPEVRWTSRALLAGTIVSMACLLTGFGLALLGAPAEPHDPRRLDLVLRAAVELRPWGWSMLGVLVLLATPPAGLLVTALELRREQPRTALLALLVLAILLAAATAALGSGR